MGYKKVTREEFERYMASNPNSSYMRNGQEITPERTYADEEGQSGIMKLLTSLSKPFRAVGGSVAEAFSKGGDYDNPFLTEREEENFRTDPTKWGTKQASSLGAYLVPGGGVGTTAGKRIGSAALKGAVAGSLSGFGVSDDEDELENILKGAGLGGLLGGALQGVGEGAKALTRTAGGGKVVNTLDVDEIAKLPTKTRSGLVKQAKSAGFWDTGVSESQNIKNYLTNRGLAGNTAGETLENLTQEFNKASKLKQEGLEEIGGLSRGYKDQILKNLDESIKYKGIGLDSETTKVYNDIVKTLKKGPQGAKALDKIVMKWNKAGRLASGAQKTSLAGLYADAANSVRSVMRNIPKYGTKYNEGLTIINQILGIGDDGVVVKAAQVAERGGIDLPLFSGAGFRGADIKTPAISNTISKARASVGRAQELGSRGLLGEGLSGSIQGLASGVQRVAPALGGQIAGQPQVSQEIPQGQPQGGQLQGQQVSSEELEALKFAIAEAIYSGQISSSDAEAVMGLLGLGEVGSGEMSANQSKATALQESLNTLKEAWESGGQVGELFGQGIGEKGRSLDTAKRLVAENLGRLQSQGAINEGERQEFLKMLPNIMDSEANVQQKFDGIQNIINSYL